MTARDPASVLDENEQFGLILLGGLPGAGKTWYLDRILGRGWIVYDDFQANTPNDSTLFRNAPRFDALVADLRGRRKCVVADIRVVHSPYRDDARLTLRSHVGPIAVQVQQFENDPAQCSLNLQRNRERNFQDRLDAIRHWTRHYSLDAEALLLRVWRPSR